MENYFVYFGQVKQWQRQGRQGDFVWAGRWHVSGGWLEFAFMHEFSADINLYWEITAGNWFINVAVEEKQDELHITLKLTVSFVVVFGKLVKKFYVFVISNVVMQPFSFSDKK